jgi:hypothetical protein
MKLTQSLVILQWVNIVFGSGYLKRLIVVEFKYLFGIYVNIWKTIEHDRFHTHAFAAVSFMIIGEYDEERLSEDGSVKKYTVKAPLVRIIGRNSNHRMLEARGTTVSITIIGPWDRIWSETMANTRKKRFLTWGRKVVYQEDGFESDAKVNG